MRMDWLRMLFSLCCQHALCAIPARVTALCHKRERCHREVTGQDTVEHMCWVVLLIDHLVDLKANRLLPYNRHMPSTDDSKSCSYELHNTIFAWPRRAEHLETRNGESQSINSPCSKKLQRLDVQIGPRKQCQLQ